MAGDVLFCRRAENLKRTTKWQGDLGQFAHSHCANIFTYLDTHQRLGDVNNVQIKWG